MTGIYKIENLVNGKLYIGQSVDIEHRWYHHRRELRGNYHGNNHLQNSWNKYGENNFNFEVIELCDKNDLDEKEKYYIKFFNSNCFDNGYNITSGGNSYYIINPILQFNKKGEFIKEWECCSLAANELNILVSNIYLCLNHKLWCAGKYIWLLKTEYENNPDILEQHINNLQYKIILQYDLDANFIREWDSQKEITETLGLNPTACCMHITKSCGGFIFKYYNDPLEITKEYCDYVKNIFHHISNKSFFQVDKNCQIIKMYNTLKEAENDGWNERMVNECVRHLRDSYKGYVWIYENEYNDLTIEECNNLLKPKKHKSNVIFMQYDLDNNYLRDFTAKELKQNNFLLGNVHDCCKGRKPQYKGYNWKYKE